MVDVMGPGHWQPDQREHTARNAWAPDISVDAGTGRLVVVWASTVKGEFSDTAESSENGYVGSSWECRVLDCRACVGCGCGCGCGRRCSSSSPVPESSSASPLEPQLVPLF